jgi:uncharacterized iron-regulated protein
MGRLQFLKALGCGFFQNGMLIVALIAVGGMSSSAGAETVRVLDGKSGVPLNLSQVVSELAPGTVVLLGEQHGLSFHAKQQLQVIKMAQESGKLTSVGMEFFEYPYQRQVIEWRQGKLNEADFLRQIGWGSISFDFYRRQVQVPRLGLEGLLALNAPRSLTSKVANAGMGSLSASELGLLPPQFERGNSRYFERFKKAIGHLPDPSMAENYFMAQSIWDDTMAWRASKFMKRHPEQILFIIVGEFHVQYGGGLPDRLRSRGIKNILSISLLNLDGMSEQEEAEAVRPSDLDGPRADVILATRP